MKENDQFLIYQSLWRGAIVMESEIPDYINGVNALIFDNKLSKTKVLNSNILWMPDKREAPNLGEYDSNGNLL